MAYADQTKYGDPPKWKDTDFSDVDNSNTGKCQDDIDGGIGASCVGDLTRKEGYVRTVDDVGSTFIEMAVACKYFVRVAGNSHMTAFGTAFNPCTGTFYSTAAIGSTMNDNNAWTGLESTIDLFGIPAWDNSTGITSASWGGSFNPTAVVVSDLQSRSTRRGVEVTWNTASEVGTVGFNLYRKDPATGAPVQVNTSLVPAMHGSPNGGRYALLDPGAPPSMESTYILEEIESQGTRREYGPFHARPRYQDGGAPGPEEGQSWRRDSRDDDPGVARLQAPRLMKAKRAGARQAASPGSAARVIVADAGLQVVTSSDVANSLGIAEDAARALIRERRLRISGPDGEVACQPSSTGDRLFFLGRPLDTTWANTAVYWLTGGECRAFGHAAGSPSRAPHSDQATTFVDQAHLEQDLTPTPALFQNPDDDFWLWKAFLAGHATMGSWEYEFQAPDSTGGPGEVTVHLQGSSNSNTGRDHHVRVSLNGSSIGETRWAGATPASVSFTVAAAIFRAGTNSMKIEAILDEGLPYSVFALDSFDVAWKRNARAVGDHLMLPRGTTGDVVVEGFTASDIWVLDVARPAHPVLLTGVATGERGGAWFARFDPHRNAGPFLAVRTAAAFAPAVVPVPSRPRLESLAKRGADYLIVTSPELASAAAQLAALRMEALVVTTDQIYDEFGGGNLDPRAIRAFLGEVHAKWRHRPRFVVLAGSGTYDGRNLLGVGDNHVPPMLVETPTGIAPSDVALADVEGDDGVPEFAIGRIPASSEAELLAYVEKLAAYEADSGAWAGKALFVADNRDAGGFFDVDSTTSAARLRGTMTVLEATVTGDPASTRAQTLQALQDGVGLFHYFGHAGTDRLAQEGLLTSADVDALASGSRTPIALLMTCVAGFYGYPGYDSLGVRLTNRVGGGALATWTSSAAEMHADSRVLSQAALGRLADGSRPSFGEAIRSAMAASRDAGSPLSTRLTYNLFGDPAVRLKR
jgi:hypothetical protein